MFQKQDPEHYMTKWMSNRRLWYTDKLLFHDVEGDSGLPTCMTSRSPEPYNGECLRRWPSWTTSRSKGVLADARKRPAAYRLDA
jgi:hypothetical protein